ncbi:thioredoxin domain-containing protein [Halorubrum vacuolatum]|uniref:Protein-disulfide isomerase n=1 Tax=Halorubrum vacuolatum TaxID=63740 RepID=A0A238VCT2_HALVU|nr:thioredoxin domain-containing protein [Halorubrum vacuolatum]SNR32031.1 Protein-disulfide isomerase [Halorubrum vacuolatum]
MEHSRRTVLAAGVAGVVGVAGCLGDDAPDTPEYDCEGTEPAEPDTDYRPMIGDPESDVLVEVFEDFTCDGCATFKADVFPTIAETYIETEEIRYEHWDFPIPVNEEWAVPVASAARGVGAREGDAAFFSFAETIYEFIGNYSEDAIGFAAEEAGADPCAAIADAENRTYATPIGDDRAEGEARGLSATPTVYVNGDEVDPTAEAISTAVDEVLS